MYPREVMKRALELGATAVIMVATKKHPTDTTHHRTPDGGLWWA
jgi:DNA repair protein RadC